MRYSSCAGLVHDCLHGNDLLGETGHDDEGRRGGMVGGLGSPFKKESFAVKAASQ